MTLGRNQPGSPRLFGQTQVGVVLPQQQAELRPAGEHAVRLWRPASDQVIDKHADVTLRTFHVERGLLIQLQRGIGPRDQPLRRGLFVARRAIDLPREIKPPNRLGFQSRVQLRGRTIVILDRITGAQDVGVF